MTCFLGQNEVWGALRARPTEQPFQASGLRLAPALSMDTWTPGQAQEISKSQGSSTQTDRVPEN